MSMDAGKFHFNRITGPSSPKAQPPVSKGPLQAPSVQNDPSESYVGSQAPAAPKTDVVSTETGQPKNEGVLAFNLNAPLSSIPTEIDGQMIAGIGSRGVGKPSFEGISALQGLNSTNIQTIGGRNIASVNPLSPKDAVKMPTTSVSTFGIEDSSWLTTSGRVIDLK